VTHEYTILTGGRVLATLEAAGTAPAAPQVPPPTAIAWAEDTVLAVGSDKVIRAVSRGDSRFHDLHGAIVRPLDGDGRLEPGAIADFLVLDPESDAHGPARRPIAVVRAGRVVEGALP